VEGPRVLGASGLEGPEVRVGELGPEPAETVPAVDHGGIGPHLEVPAVGLDALAQAVHGRVDAGFVLAGALGEGGAGGEGEGQEGGEKAEGTDHG